MGAFLLTWCVVALWLAVPYVANRLAVALALRVKGDHDRAIADDLPQTAGDWLRDRLGRALGAIVTDDRARLSTNAFHPTLQMIQLTDETHFKADPAYWAIAAHELGHAELHRRWPLLAALTSLARRLRRIVVPLGVGIAACNLLYAQPGALALAFGLLLGGMLLYGLELIDEAWASFAAYRELRWSHHLSPRHLRAVRAVLRTSFLTYLVTFAGFAVLLAQWHLVEELTGAGRFGGTADLTTLGWIGVAVASAICVVHLAWSVVRAVSPADVRTRRPRTTLRDLVVPVAWKLALVALIALVWDLHAGATWAWCVMLAATPAAGLIGGVAGLPSLPLLLGVLQVAKRLEGPGIDRTAEYRRARRAGRALVEQGNRAIDLLLDLPGSWRSRALGLVQLAYVPLLVVLWLA